MSERECTCKFAHVTRRGTWDDCPIHGNPSTESETIVCPTCDGAEPVDECPVCKETRFTIPPLNADKGAQNMPKVDETARNVENCPVVERLEKRITAIEHLTENAPHSRYTTGVYDHPLLKDALSAIHDLQVEAASQEREYKAEQDGLRSGLSALVTSVDSLIMESDGVCGLHLNGDDASWESLTEGGEFEAWLLTLEIARQALTGGQE